MLTANTAYEVFLALPEKEKENFMVLVNNYKFQPVLSFDKKSSKPKLTKQEAIELLLNTVFTSKKGRCGKLEKII